MSLRTRQKLNVHHHDRITVGGAVPGGGLNLSSGGRVTLAFGPSSLRLASGQAPFSSRRS